MLDGHPRSCSNGIPLASHRRCVACGVLMGCRGEEPPADSDPRLCAACGRESSAKARRFLKPTEVALLLGLSPRTVLRAIHSGRLRATLLGRPAGPNGRRYIISRSALAAFLGEDPLE
jgi:excisionase family DNA binding protein